MIKIIAKMTIQEDKVEACKNIIEDLVEATRKEDGCIQYQLFQDVRNTNVLTFIEEWQNNDAFKIHTKTEHFLNIMPKIKEMLEKDMEVSINTLVY